jgi:hypothetical protein
MYVQQGATADQQNLFVAGLMALANPTEDAALKAWAWTPADAAAALSAMTAYTAQADWNQAYRALGAYQYQGKPLPLKVGASVALKYIAKIL